MIFSGLSITEILQNFIVLFFAITVHEYAHGFVAYKLGDPTSKSMGRLTLNPLAHLDPIGSLMMIFCGFGWAKPVPVNPYYFKKPKMGMVLVSLAGPISNITLSFICVTLSPILQFIFLKLGFVDNVAADFIIELIWHCAILNVFFAVFNLIPFPPLDGSKILFALLPNRIYNNFLRFERYGTIILILLAVTDILDKILDFVSYPVLLVLSYWGGIIGVVLSLFL